MAVKLTKNELKTQKDKLKQFERFLPTLVLKKQQLQSVIRQIYQRQQETREEQKRMIGNLDEWIAVFSENRHNGVKDICDLVQPEKVDCGEENIAGVTIPVFRELLFKPLDYDLREYPLWTDTAVYKLREICRLDALVRTYDRQVELLDSELRTTTQRVNLFEKVKIPEAKENIKRIQIYLGDQQTSGVVRGKIAKKKLSEGGAA